MKFVDLQKQRQRIKKEIDASIQKVLQHGRFIMGPEVMELEQRLAEFTQTKYCVGVSSGTDALLIAMLACGIKAGDEVITTPFTFFATGEIILLLGAIPIYVDIDLKTYNIDANQLENKITAKTKLIIPVDLYGQPANYQLINNIAHKYHIPVIEDAAQSLGATQGDKRTCNLSTIGCTSFFPSKPLGCYGDGGACFTNDKNLAIAMRQLRTHGQSKRYCHERIGINGRLDSLQAAILLQKLTLFEEEILLRQEIGQYYTELLKDKVITPYIAPENTSVYAQYTIRVNNRNAFREALQQHDIPTACHYPLPFPEQPIVKRLHQALGFYPHTQQACREVVSLPMHPYLSKSEIQRIDEVITKIYTSEEMQIN